MPQRHIRLTFVATGESVLAEMLDDEAPGVCEHVWNCLPVQTKTLHGMYSGAEVFTVLDNPRPAPRENLTQLPLPGEILYFYDDAKYVTAHNKPVAEICVVLMLSPPVDSDELASLSLGSGPSSGPGPCFGVVTHPTSASANPTELNCNLDITHLLEPYVVAMPDGEAQHLPSLGLAVGKRGGARAHAVGERVLDAAGIRNVVDVGPLRQPILVPARDPDVAYARLDRVEQRLGPPPATGVERPR